MADPNQENSSSSQGYLVVARRFRPQSFSDLVGQGTVSQALSNAIDRDRVGHAYLFAGARGVGKTSTARIFAKCLNCETGPTDQPCETCDSCQGITSGEDVDVLEIDGASNNGVDQIRQLRANVSILPSRSRFKIYVVDEVHMLSKSAFNALLKTLEEPPAHVKFFFCTTDPEKIPITVLSRCQRFDLPPISIEQIKQRLHSICQELGVEIEEAALEILARRAGGSMRDSQSLLDQLFSFCGDRITASDVHTLLGTADSGRVLELLDAVIESQTVQALTLVGDLIDGGVEAGQLTEQLLNVFRDMMASRVGCGEEQFLYCNSADAPKLQELAASYGLEQTLAAVEVLDNALIRMRQSSYVRTLLETAVVRICKLPNLQLIADLVEQAKSGSVNLGNPQASSSAPQKKTAKKNETVKANIAAPAATSAQSSLASGDQSAGDVVDESATAAPDSEPTPQLSINEHNCEQVWRKAISSIDGMTGDVASSFSQIDLQGDKLIVTMVDAYHRDTCQRPERKSRLEQSLRNLTGRPMQIEFLAQEKSKPKGQPKPPQMSRIQKIRQIERDPFVKQAIELFDAEIGEVVSRTKPAADE